MKTEKLNQIFENQSDWDFEEPNLGHEERFLSKLRQNKTKKRQIIWLPLSIAATLVISLGIILFTIANPKTEKIAISPQVKETQIYYSTIINTELETLKKKENQHNKVIIKDAIREMKSLEKDYHSLTQEISKNGENKQIVYALITNLQTRISFIKTVLNQVESIDNLKNNTDEKNI